MASMDAKLVLNSQVWQEAVIERRSETNDAYEEQSAGYSWTAFRELTPQQDEQARRPRQLRRLE